MVQREYAEHPRCPSCGRELRPDHDELRCEEHGSFFAYGPQLLVRSARDGERVAKPAMPWEKVRSE